MGDRNMALARAEFHGGGAMGKREQRKARPIIIFSLPFSLFLSLSVVARARD